jgi:hypothetical protein
MIRFIVAVAAVLVVVPAQAAGFKVANVHLETNASACDMGIQIAFDTEGVTEGRVRDPSGARVYHFDSVGGMKATGGQTEGFLEGIEPQISEIVKALGCAPSDEGKSSLADFVKQWPAGVYTFEGEARGVKLEDRDELTYHIPAGPRITAPSNGAVVGSTVLINWRPVTAAIIPSLGPVKIVGYHVIVEPSGIEAPPEFEIDLPATVTSVRVPPQFLRPYTTYQLEVLATEESGNQTITEGYFCTSGLPSCDKP